MTETNKLPRVVFRLTNCGRRIEPLLAVKETAKTLAARELICLRGGQKMWGPYTRRVLKDRIFEYAYDAIQELERQARKKLERKKRELDCARSELERVRALSVDDIRIPPIPEDVEG